jgi:hypothetical protein
MNSVSYHSPIIEQVPDTGYLYKDIQQWLWKNGTELLPCENHTEITPCIASYKSQERCMN